MPSAGHPLAPHCVHAHHHPPIRMSASRCPCGVIAYQGDIVCYELGPQQPGAATSSSDAPEIRARHLGHKSLLDITPELRAAIEADLRKHHKAE